MRAFIVALLVALLLVGCVTQPTDTSTPKPSVPGVLLPPMPTQKSLTAKAMSPKFASLTAGPQMKVASLSVVFVPNMTNVLTIRLVYTNQPGWYRQSRTNATLVWRTNSVPSGDYIVSYPTNAWEYALVWRSNIVSGGDWRAVSLATNLPSRTTNGQWFEHTLQLRFAENRFFQLAKTYTVGLMWNYTYNYGTNAIMFRAYTGSSSRSYTSVTNLTWADTYIGTETNAPNIGDGLFSTWLTGLIVGQTNYLAMTAMDMDGLESDFSIELLLPPMNR